MATYFVASGGSNTAPYDTWAKAATSLQTALTAATATGDLVILQYNAVPSGDAEVAGTTTYTLGGHIALIAASNDGGSAWTPVTMGASYWIGNSTVGRAVTITGSYKFYCHGVTFRRSGTGGISLMGTSADNAQYLFDNCYLYGTYDSNNTATFNIGAQATSNTWIVLRNTILRFGGTGEKLNCRGAKVKFENCTVSRDGSIPSTFLSWDNSTPYAASLVECEGCDFSAITGRLVADWTGAATALRFYNCKFGTGVTIYGSQTPAQGSATVELYNCASGDQQYHYGYFDTLGEVTATTDIRAVDGASYDGTQRYSWKITTTANCTFYTPFVTPWFGTYHNGTSPISPYVEVLRNGSSTPFTDAEVWGEYSTQETYGSTLATIRSGRMALTGVAEAHPTGIGAYNWQGWYDGTWSGKLSCPAKVLPQAPGDLKARICVGAASTTLYVDPQVRT